MHSNANILIYLIMIATRKSMMIIFVVFLYEGRHYAVMVCEIVCVIAITYNVITNKNIMAISEIYNYTYEIKLMVISSTSSSLSKKSPAKFISKLSQPYP